MPLDPCRSGTSSPARGRSPSRRATTTSRGTCLLGRGRRRGPVRHRRGPAVGRWRSRRDRSTSQLRSAGRRTDSSPPGPRRGHHCSGRDLLLGHGDEGRSHPRVRLQRAGDLLHAADHQWREGCLGDSVHLAQVLPGSRSGRLRVRREGDGHGWQRGDLHQEVRGRDRHPGGERPARPRLGAGDQGDVRPCQQRHVRGVPDRAQRQGAARRKRLRASS